MPAGKRVRAMTLASRRKLLSRCEGDEKKERKEKKRRGGGRRRREKKKEKKMICVNAEHTRDREIGREGKGRKARSALSARAACRGVFPLIRVAGRTRAPLECPRVEARERREVVRGLRAVPPPRQPVSPSVIRR